jgi:hypothetical protein
MSITEEIQRLVSLRDQGHLTEAEFEKAKAKLLSDAQDETQESLVDTNPQKPTVGIPGLWVAVGVFFGNLLIISISSGDIGRGFFVGATAAVLVIVFYAILNTAKPKMPNKP